jgi:hypothetical protein
MLKSTAFFTEAWVTIVVLAKQFLQTGCWRLNFTWQAVGKGKWKKSIRKQNQASKASIHKHKLGSMTIDWTLLQFFLLLPQHCGYPVEVEALTKLTTHTWSRRVRRQNRTQGKMQQSQLQLVLTSVMQINSSLTICVS